MSPLFRTGGLPRRAGARLFLGAESAVVALARKRRPPHKPRSGPTTIWPPGQRPKDAGKKSAAGRGDRSGSDRTRSVRGGRRPKPVPGPVRPGAACEHRNAGLLAVLEMGPRPVVCRTRSPRTAPHRLHAALGRSRQVPGKTHRAEAAHPPRSELAGPGKLGGRPHAFTKPGAGPTSRSRSPTSS